MIDSMWASAIFLGFVGFGVAPPDHVAYQQAVGELQSVIESSVSEDRQAIIKALERLLDLVARCPDEVRSDDTVSETILRGWVILAGLYLAEGNEIAAREVMYQAIRAARGQTLPVREYGLVLNQLYQDCKASLETARMPTIAVDCGVDCNVVLSGRLLPAPPRQPPPRRLPDSPAPKPTRMLPRGVELAGVAAAVGMIVAGAVLLSVDHKCETSRQPGPVRSFPEPCGHVHETRPGGVSLLGIGAGMLVVSGVSLSIDEVRVGRERGRQVMVGVSLKF